MDKIFNTEVWGKAIFDAVYKDYSHLNLKVDEYSNFGGGTYFIKGKNKALNENQERLYEIILDGMSDGRADCVEVIAEINQLIDDEIKRNYNNVILGLKQSENGLKAYKEQI